MSGLVRQHKFKSFKPQRELLKTVKTWVEYIAEITLNLRKTFCKIFEAPNRCLQKPAIDFENMINCVILVGDENNAIQFGY